MSDLDGFRARIAVREAWKQSTGKYPYEDKALTPDQRMQDVDLHMIVAQHSELEALRAQLEVMGQTSLGVMVTQLKACQEAIETQRTENHRLREALERAQDSVRAERARYRELGQKALELADLTLYDYDSRGGRWDNPRSDQRSVEVAAWIMGAVEPPTPQGE